MSGLTCLTGPVMKALLGLRPGFRGARSLVMVGALMGSVSGQACEADEMIAQMRLACTEMIGGYQKALGPQPVLPAALSVLTQARAHCQALEFDKAGFKLALLASQVKVPK